MVVKRVKLTEVLVALANQSFLHIFECNSFGFMEKAPDHYELHQHGNRKLHAPYDVTRKSRLGAGLISEI